MSVLITLGWVCIIIAVILLILGFTIRPAAQRPGWGVLILGVALILIGYLVPYVIDATRGTTGPDCTTSANC